MATPTGESSLRLKGEIAGPNHTAMDAFNSFFDSQSSSGSHRWSYDSLKNFREISPIVQNHIKHVYFTLCVAVAASPVGAYLHVLWKIGGFLTTVVSIGSMIWLLSTPPLEEGKRVSLLMSSALFQGASIGPLIDVALAIDPRRRSRRSFTILPLIHFQSFIVLKLEQIGTPEALELRGKAAVAQAALAYQLYKKMFSGPRWERLERRGAKKQRLMWASTNVKNPAYPDTSYVESLIGPDTISTMPSQAFQAFMDHGVLSRTIDTKVSEAQGIYNAIEKLGIDWNAVGSQLEHEVLDSFTKSFDDVLQCLQKKAKSTKFISQ